ncbi:hypothetical protein [Paenibacillus marchantiophytorum]|nr:hypothetical protein [Paenibacillus marchantiophytorum]
MGFAEKVIEKGISFISQSVGAFKNLSSLQVNQAEGILSNIRQLNQSFASKRQANYIELRIDLERRIRQLFIDKGGVPKKSFPHYMTLGTCDWLKGWYKEGASLRIAIENLNLNAISFTYGDSFPAMRVQDGKPYRGQVYTFEELPRLLELYGLPQVWNCDGSLAPERYIEAQVWDDEVLKYIM